VSAPALPAAEVVCEGADRDTWLGHRRIGGSTIAAILEIDGAYGSRRTVYKELIGEGVPVEESVAMASGNWYEQRAAERFSHLSGIETFQPDPITMYRSKSLPIATASPDRLSSALDAWIEIKWVGSHRASDWTGGAPDHYIAQCKWGLAVSGLPVAYLFAEIGGQDPRWYTIENDPKWNDMAFEEAEKFYKLVEARIEPEPDGSEATKRALNAEFSEPAPTSVEGGYQLALAVASLIDAQRAAKEATSALNLAENAVKLILRESEVGTVEGQPVVTWKEQGRRSLDLDAVRKFLGGRVSEFEKDAAFRVLRVSKGAK